MAERPVDTHKRSKSSRMVSLLHRERSKNAGDGSSDIAGLTSEAGSSTVSLTSQPPSSAASYHLQQAQGKGILSIQNARHQTGSTSNLSTSPNQSAASNSRSVMESNVGSPGQGPDKSISIEQSVRMFRLFEALRSNDNTVILKAMKETCGNTVVDGNRATPSVASANSSLEGTTLLHLAIQCTEASTVDYIINTAANSPDLHVDLNAKDRDGNTPLHLASMLGRAPTVRTLLAQPKINDSIANYQGRTPLDLARTPDIFQQLQLSRSLYLESLIQDVHKLIARANYEGLENLLTKPRVQAVLDVNGGELATDPTTVQSGGTLLHEAARKKDTQLIQLLLLHGADPFRRDRKGKLPQEVTKDDKTKAMLKKSPAAAVAQRGIQEKAVLGNSQAQNSGLTTENALAGKEAREMKGYLKKWTNYTSGYKLRFFVLEDGVLSYYKHQDDAGSACRGAINMRIAKLWMDPQDKQRFEILGKSSVKYHLKANHDVEAKRWFWALNNAIQWTKDEAREEERKKTQQEETIRQAKLDQTTHGASRDADTPADASSIHSERRESRSGRTMYPGSSVAVMGPRVTFGGSSTAAGSVTAEDEDGGFGTYEPSASGDLGRVTSNIGTATIEGDLDDDEEYGDDASSREVRPASKDAFNITAQSARLQLDLLAQVSSALQAEKTKNPSLPVPDPTVIQAMTSYEMGVRSLKGLLGDLLKISRDRDAYWQYRLDREVDVRKLWEENMARLAKEQETLEGKIGESEEKRKRTKRALRDALENSAIDSRPASRGGFDGEEDAASKGVQDSVAAGPGLLRRKSSAVAGPRRKSTIAEMTNLSDSDDDNDEEFFDAVDAGEITVVDELPLSSQSPPPVAEDEEKLSGNIREAKKSQIETSFKGYEEPVRKKLKMDADDRPKISLWGILKSMIGKDMTKMTLPVSFNEPTSLLQRVAEDMEYTDLLDTAADRADSTERMVYVAAFAASEYASTIGRVAKPFNPLLGETYEYVRPDKGYRFFIEQVSHHPPIGAAYAESPKWDYYGESAVRSKFYGKSFDINPLGTWFLKLRPISGGEELYTWKKVTSSVVGIITGSPTVDNYGPMEIKNWTTGEICNLDFKQRGWRAAGAYEVKGKVLDSEGWQRWSIGGHWNDKIYARLTPGYDAPITGPSAKGESSQAFLVWEANSRPTGIPFNLTPFVVTLNAVPDSLRNVLAPTDTRLRPDQRAMEDGEYDFAATEKNRVEEKQRAARREREANGEEFVPKWFHKGTDEATGEEFWIFNGKYWKMRDEVGKGGSWKGVEDIF